MSFQLIILFAPMFVIIFWGIELLINSIRHERVKQHLAFFMLSGLFAIISGISFFLKEYAFYNATYVVVVFFALSQFPSFYVYIHSLTREKPFSYKIYIHYLIPFIAFVVAIIIHWIWLTPKENMEFVSEYLTGSPIDNSKQHVAFVADKVYKYTFILFGVFYYWLVNKRVKEHRSKMNDYFSNTEKVSLSWIKIFNILFFLVLVAGIFYHGLKREFFLQHDYLIAIPYGVQTIFYWVIGHFGSKQKEIYKRQISPESNQDKHVNTHSFSDTFKKELQTMMEIEKPYLNQDLSLPDLALLTGTNRTYLSRHINTIYKQNFKQFINEYRLLEAEKILKSGDEMDIVSVSLECGFSSYHTFNRCFKEKNKITPGTYRKINLEKR